MPRTYLKKQSSFAMIFFAAALAFILGAFFAHGQLADAEVPSVQAGTAHDPLISLSYLEQVVIPEIERNILQRLGVDFENYSGGGQDIFIPVHLMQGQTLLSREGAVEFILRTGEAVARSMHHNQGMADLTAGEEVYNNDPVSVNHAMLIPRADGRGAVVTSGAAWFMVRGDYEIY